MDCRRFEFRLEDLSKGALPLAEQRAAKEHAAGCAACNELLELVMLPVETEREASVSLRGFVESVVDQTSGAACASATASLPALADGSLEREQRVLVAAHVAECAECDHLVTLLSALRRDLPRLAEVRPDAGFVADVLKRTLPVNVQLRRWWGRTWTRWLHRPRFASELAYIGSLVLVLVVATPGSPLEAVPRRALAAVQQPIPIDVEEYLAAPADAVQALTGSPGAERVGKWIAAGAGKAQQADEVVDKAAEGLATFWRGAASLMGNDGTEAGTTTSETPEMSEENR